MEKLKCLRCEHIWEPKTDKIPIVCPKCKSGYWNRPRKIKELHPDEKPQEIIEQYEEEIPIENPGTIPEFVMPVDKDIVILKCLDSIMKTLKRMETRPVIANGTDKIQVFDNSLTYTKEQASESLVCARTHQFICNGEGKELCPICKQQNFWKNAQNLRIALEMESLDKPGENAPEETFETKSMNCKERTTNAGKPFCVYKYKGEAHHNYCVKCWEMISVWGDQAAGYKEQMAAKGRNR